MRIDRLRLADYRGIRHAEVRFAPTGVTIIEGDNEVGKSSLLEAIDLVLSIRDDSKKEAIRNLQPHGRDVGPEVEVDITTGPYRFTLRKRWLRRSETVLEVHEPRRETLTGREAHDRVQAILGETVDLALWDALRLSQGADAGGVGFDVPALGRALDRAAGGSRTSDREDHLWAKVVEERNRYWTATGKPSADRTALARRLAEAEEEVRAVEAELRQLQAHVDEMARLEAESAELTARQRELDAHVEQLRQQAAEVTALRAQVAQHEADCRTAQAVHERWVGAAEARQALVDAVAERTARLEAAEAALAGAEPAGAAARRRLEAAEEARRAAAARFADAEAAHELAQADLEHRRQEIEVAQLRERHERVVEQRAALAEAEAALEAITIDADGLAAIEAAHLEVVRAEAAATAGAATVAVVALDDTAVEVDGQVHELGAGEQISTSVPHEGRVIVPGVVEVRVTAGAEAQALADRVAAAQAELARCCERAGVADLAAARAALARREAAEQVVRSAHERIQADLRDLTVDDLAHKVERLSERLAAHRAGRAPEPPMPVDLDAAQVHAAATGAELAAARRALDEAEAVVAAAVDACRQVEVDHAELVAQVRMEREALAAAEAALAAARDAEPDEALAEALEASRVALEGASVQLTVAEASLRRLDPDTVEELLANAEQAQARGQAALAANRDQRRKLEATLETKGEQGLAERRDRAITAREHLQLEHDRHEARAAAALALYEAFERRRAEAHARYLAPFREAIERLGRVVFGPTLEVELTADLRIATRTLNGVTLPLDQLSAGAREQLGILSRLACASIVAGDDGAPVLLDDTLGWTDPQRLAQMAAAIGVAGRHSQIILLTCTPGRFAHVGAATVVRLPDDARPADAVADTA